MIIQPSHSNCALSRLDGYWRWKAFSNLQNVAQYIIFLRSISLSGLINNNLCGEFQISMAHDRSIFQTVKPEGSFRLCVLSAVLSMNPVMSYFDTVISCF